ncbi:hypothetical protein [Actinomadura sp. 6N118]|uniref:hypothetical protein n=1 Tax=Actinomadura sp. 6N118 TaxID=3375151 RepID=UPI003788F156
MNGVKGDHELWLLGELCKALAQRGIVVQLRDAIPGLTVTTPRGVSAYVVMNGPRFTWWRVDNSHPVSDIDGAARRIAMFLRQGEQSGAGGARP